MIKSCENCIRFNPQPQNITMPTVCSSCEDMSLFVPVSRQEADEDRIDVVGQNGNDGLVYHHLHKHGHRPKSKPSKTYSSWLSMKSRCNDTNNSNYGGSGITYDKRWDDFINFLADMGERPKGTTIDRIDPLGNYSKENCRWSNSKQQSRNKRTNIVIEFNGKKQVLIDIANEYNVPLTTIYRRHHQGVVGADLVLKINRNCYRKGEKSPSHKLTDKDVALIRDRLYEGHTTAAIAKMFNVKQPTISNIKTGKTWKP